jgi:hypothetical protein
LADKQSPRNLRHPWILGITVACVAELALDFLPASPGLLFPVPLLLAGISALWAGASAKKAVLIAVVGGVVAFIVFLVVALILFTIHLAIDYP